MNRGIYRYADRAALAAAMVACVLAPVAPAAVRADRDLEQRLRAHIEVLASDEFQGREPGTDGEAKTLRYLGKQWFNIGLVSGTNDPSHEWFSPVTLTAREPASYAAQFARKGQRLPMAQNQILVLTSGKRSLVREAPLLFVGRGNAQEFTRNELAGRVAVLLDGAAIAGSPKASERQNQLLAQGASAVLTVLDGERSLDQVSARRRRTG
jgi:hypothetical protein